MRDFLLKLVSCWSLAKDGKVSPLRDDSTVGDVNASEDREDSSVLDVIQQDETTHRAAELLPVEKCPPAPMSQPRPGKSSSDVLVQLREEGVLPLKCHGDSVAFEVPAEKPISPSKRQSHRSIKLDKLEGRLEDRRRKFRKKSGESETELERQLSNADVRRREILTERSRKLANRAAEQATKVTSKKPSGTAFVLKSVSDSDVIATRESRALKALEKRLALRRARVAKKSSQNDLQKRQADAAERRQVQMEATVAKAKKFAAGSSLGPVSEGEPEEDSLFWDQEPLETYESGDSDSEYVF
ncbi:Hypp1980 [Branchiostoma lanceolatum]|uniref:Hypp1980 protein n=1 Tax=Branchiostoma lanceolatum TaxID=7740 RepID=A0A8K0EQV5_BRALA|nr:Hypp1980 [Branchiostoma lanceolatum]